MKGCIRIIGEGWDRDKDGRGVKYRDKKVRRRCDSKPGESAIFLSVHTQKCYMLLYQIWEGEILTMEQGYMYQLPYLAIGNFLDTTQLTIYRQ